jgi:predicted Fe-S protein YdhL (DUF1289 family)
MESIIANRLFEALSGPVATCVGCGCTDHEACSDGCTWLDVDYDEQSGVCSNCPDHLQAWQAEHPFSMIQTWGRT